MSRIPLGSFERKTLGFGGYQTVDFHDVGHAQKNNQELAESRISHELLLYIG